MMSDNRIEKNFHRRVTSVIERDLMHLKSDCRSQESKMKHSPPFERCFGPNLRGQKLCGHKARKLSLNIALVAVLAQLIIAHTTGLASASSNLSATATAEPPYQMPSQRFGSDQEHHSDRLPLKKKISATVADENTHPKFASFAYSEQEQQGGLEQRAQEKDSGSRSMLPESRKETKKEELARFEHDRVVRNLLLANPSARNLELARKLQTGQLDYQLFYATRSLEHEQDNNWIQLEENKKQRSKLIEKPSGGLTTSGPKPRSERSAGKPLREPEEGFLVSTLRQMPAWRHSSSASSTATDAAGIVSNDQFEAISSESSRSRQQRPALSSPASNSMKANQALGHYNRTNVVIKAFNYKFRLDLELNNNLFGPGLIQKHFLPKGAQQISTQKIEHCYYHARSQPEARPIAIGAFTTCNGLSGIIHIENESFVVHPFSDSDPKRDPHIIYRYPNNAATFSANQHHEQNQSSSVKNNPTDSSLAPNRRECANAKLHEWALRKYNKFATSPNGQQSQTMSVENGRLSRRSALGATLGKQLANCSQDVIVTSDQMNSACDIRQRADASYESARTSQSSSSLVADKVKNKSESGNPKVQQQQTRFSKRDVGLTEKYIELALILSQDMFDKRNSSSRLDVLHDAIQIVNCLDLYFRSANTRVALIYIETWAYGDQIELSSSVKQTVYNFLEYSTRKLYKVSMDAVHLLTGGHTRQFEANEVGISIPDSICSSRAVSVSQEAGVNEPFIAAATIAHMLGHNLGMEHDEAAPFPQPLPLSAADKQAELGQQHQATALASSLEPSQQEPSEEQQQQQAKSLQSDSTKHQQQQQPNGHAHGNSLPDQEEAEDEIKSRSLVLDSSQSSREEDDENHSGLMSAHCTANCLMSEHFVYLQPPVSFGNMIQQQVATQGANQSQSGVTLFSVHSAGNEQPQMGEQPFGSSNHLNGPTMNQIDNELQNGDHHLLLNSLPFKFSRKSIETYHKLLRLGHGICLFNKPNQLEDFKTCGNGIVDKGEDCDCGTFQECLESDSCCDPITCRFKADAECINGACCDRCKLRQRGFVCRKARGECDLAEHCDGKSGQCSPDVHKQNGFPCSAGAGFCYLGQCPSHDAQCSELWGSDARSSDRQCYAGFNLNGTIRGNCGLDATQRKFRRCDHEHMMCGTLQCQLGDMKPVTASIETNSLASASTFSQDNNNSNTRANAQPEFSTRNLKGHECKAITGPLAPSSPQLPTSNSGGASSIGYVRDGSKCAPGKVCFNQTCQPIEQVYRDAFELCPRDERGQQCSGNGICSTANRCHCEPNWSGHDCSQRWAPSSLSLPPTPTPTPMQSSEQQSQFHANINGSSQSGLAIFVAPNSSAEFKRISPTLELNLSAPINDPERHSERNPLISFKIINQEQLDAVRQAASNLQRDNQQAASQAAGVSSSATTLAAKNVSADSPAAASQTAANLTQAPPAPPPPPPVVSPSNVVLDKNKHDALGAPTLVFILVSIVAAVYVGFALMANCYRRKGFLKPDKVLRHHQMNCKLDAIRSSFIAKRLADAAAGIETGVGPLGGPSGVGNQTALPYVSSISATGPPTCQHMTSAGAQIYGNANNEQVNRVPQQTELNTTAQLGPDELAGGTGTGTLKGFRAQPCQGIRGARSAFGSQQMAAGSNVHYFNQEASQQHDYFQQQQHNEPGQASFGYDADLITNAGDHIPLLVATGNPSDTMLSARRQRPQAMNQLMMRSFHPSNAASQAKKLASNSFAPSQQYSHDHWQHSAFRAQQVTRNQQQQQQQQQRQQQHQQLLINQQNRINQINRTASLGNVSRQNKARHLAFGDDFGSEMNDDGGDYETSGHVMSHQHRALATPVRTSNLMEGGSIFMGGHRQRKKCSEDNCSAPSSPDHRDPYWSDAERQRTTRCSHSSFGRQQSASGQLTFAGENRGRRGGGYHEDVIMGVLSGGQQHQHHHQHQQHLRRNLSNVQGSKLGDELIGRQRSFENPEDDLDGEDEELPLPPPPPPLPPAPSQRDGGEEAGSEDSESPSLTTASYRSKRQSEPTLAARSPLLRTIKRVPLNSGDLANADSLASTGGVEHLTLIAQLQQLERVQSLHQKQVQAGGDKQLGGGKMSASSSTGEGLHEFFSLPLSVQLSALLARSLRENQRDTSSMTPINEILNTLNNSSVATSSRRNFKEPHQQQTAAPSLGGSLKRQQIKLHNLQGLINRLQKLHNQTLLQQQLDELNGELDDDMIAQGSQQSTLTRSSQAHSSRSTTVSRANQMMIVDDLFTVFDKEASTKSESVWAKKRRPARPRGHEAPVEGISKNESVYSMSDSEDGAFVSRMLISYQQQKQQQQVNHNQATNHDDFEQEMIAKHEVANNGINVKDQSHEPVAGSKVATETGNQQQPNDQTSTCNSSQPSSSSIETTIQSAN